MSRVTTEEEHKRRKQRSLAIALGIAGFVALVYVVTLLRLSAAAGGG